MGEIRIKLLPLITQQEVLTYLDRQKKRGADKYPYFEKVKQGIQNYGEFGEGLTPDIKQRLTWMLGTIAQCGANGLLDRLDTELSVNGANPGTGTQLWLDFWLTKGMTQDRLVDELKAQLASNPIRTPNQNKDTIAFLLKDGGLAIEDMVLHLGSHRKVARARDAKKAESAHFNRRK